MYPAQVNIFVEDSKSRKKAKQAFDEMNQNLKMNVNVTQSYSNSKKMSVYDMQKRQSFEKKRQKKVTFLMSFSDPKMYQLIFAGGFRVAAACLSIQNSRLYL